MLLQRLGNEAIQHTATYFFGTARSVLLGIGLSHAIEHENYEHAPLILLFPSVYAGYHAHRNKDSILDWIIASKKKIKGTWL